MTNTNLIDRIGGITTVVLKDDYNTYTKGILLLLEDMLVRKIESDMFLGVNIVLKGYEDKECGPLIFLLDVADSVMDSDYTRIIGRRMIYAPHFSMNGNTYSLLDMSLRSNGTTDSKLFGIMDKYRQRKATADTSSFDPITSLWISMGA